MNNITIKDVAKETGLSTATVSYAINGKKKLPEETLKLVFDAIEKLGYVKNYSASSLSGNTSNLIGVVIPQTEPGKAMVFENPFYSEMLSSIEYNARQKGYHIIVSGTNADEKYFNLANQRNLDGIIIIGVYPVDFYEGLKKSNIPIVLVDSYLNTHNYSMVKLDDYLGGYQATKYLIEHGHKKIAFISGTLKEGGVNVARFEGYKSALMDAGIPFLEEQVLTGTIDFESGKTLAAKMIERLDNTAVFCTADIMAIGILKKLSEMKISVPERMSVIGFDNLNIANYCTPGLTTIGQDIFKKGQKAVEILYKSIKNTENKTIDEIILPIEIVERESVRRIEIS
ncbi:MAG: LacI family transcriptional regulator [Clostridiales bacterium]|nr:LacI family transcriptional regulator [Clostridiales bacterium]